MIGMQVLNDFLLNKCERAIRCGFPGEPNPTDGVCLHRTGNGKQKNTRQIRTVRFGRPASMLELRQSLEDFMTTLFDPIKIGRLTCPNRIWMAPLTRGRGTREHVPTELMATYYAQRASAGLMISEATGITIEGSGWPYAGGLMGQEHVAHWKTVTDAVHKAGGRIYSQ